LSGAGAALKGRRFNWPGLETLYLSLTFNTVFREVSGGFAHRLTPQVLCSYDVDCDDIADLRTDSDRAALGVDLSDLSCPWGNALIAGREPESWSVVRRLRAAGHAGILVPSFANGATADDQNLVLWRAGRRDRLPAAQYARSCSTVIKQQPWLRSRTSGQEVRVG